MRFPVQATGKKSIADIAFRLHADHRGNVLILTVIAIPALLITMLGGMSVMMALAKKQELVAIVQETCSRMVKPQRAVIMDDNVRQQHGEEVFDALAADHKFNITSRTVTAEWLQGDVSAKAKVPVMPGVGPDFELPISAATTCEGIPPYPALGDVIMSSNFRTPTGDAVDLPKLTPNIGRWGLFNPKVVGWDGGTGYGVEIQDWSTNPTPNSPNKLPEGVSSPFVVELDSAAQNNHGVTLIGGTDGGLLLSATASTCHANYNVNSSMYKVLELHPGTYRFSLWFRARHFFPTFPNAADTNAIEVTVEGIRPASSEVVKLHIDNQVNTDWGYHYFDVPVDSYGVYKFGIRAAGCGDSVGGLFNDLKLTYIQRPYPEYNDPLPAPPTPNAVSGI